MWLLCNALDVDHRPCDYYRLLGVGVNYKILNALTSHYKFIFVNTNILLNFSAFL